MCLLVRYREACDLRKLVTVFTAPELERFAFTLLRRNSQLIGKHRSQFFLGIFSGSKTSRTPVCWTRVSVGDSTSSRTLA